MLFNSIDFLLFFPLVTILYFLLPHRVRWVWLLISSYFFYMCWNAKYALLIALSTLITYLSGLLIHRAEAVPDEKRRERRKRLWVFLSFASNLAILFFFKYFNFFLDNLSLVLSLAGLSFKRPAFDVMLPVGISFYTFQALSYTVDVYRREVKPERNPFRYALFVSFFPQLVAGPIERSKNLLNQLYERHDFDPDRVREGLLLMLWGMFEKIVIADRLAILVDFVYDPENFLELPGTAIVLATIFFAFQIYCDFAGYTHIAIGAAQVMGFRLMENFRRPYLATSVADFWHRWHISLSTWFRDYLYIPLGGNRKGRVRKYFNTMVTFLVSGLWHGANWSFVVWGGLNGAYQVAGELLAPARERVCRVLRINRESFFWRFIRTVFTFGLVDFSWLFFRASTFSISRQLLVHMFTQPHPFVFMGRIFDLGLDKLNFFAALVGIAVLLAADLFQEYRGPIRPLITRQILPVRWVIYMGGVLAVLIFGIYGPGYDAASFIYFQF